MCLSELVASTINTDAAFHIQCSYMAPKGGNAKKEAGRAKKAENEQKKKDAAAAEKVSGNHPDRLSIAFSIYPPPLTFH